MKEWGRMLLVGLPHSMAVSRYTPDMAASLPRKMGSGDSGRNRVSSDHVSEVTNLPSHHEQ